MSSNSANSAVQAEGGRSKRVPIRSQKAKESERQAQAIDQPNGRASATTSQQHKKVNNPSRAEIQAYINHPTQQAAREAENDARLQDQSPAARLVPVRSDKRALHTNQLAMQMHESRQATAELATHTLQNRDSLGRQPNITLLAHTDVTASNHQRSHAAQSSSGLAAHDTAVPAIPPNRQHGPAAMPPPPAPETQHIIRYSAEMAVSNPIRAVASSSQSAVHIKQTPAPRPLDRKNKKKISNQKRPKLGTLSTHGTGTRPNAKALEYYSSYLMAKYPLGLLPTMRWGTLAMRDACSELGLEELNPTKEEIKIMTYRNSNIRKPWLDAARKYTPPFYKLWGVLNDKDTKLIALNKQNVQRLLSEALFAHGNHAVPTGDSPYMSQMFYALIKACAFRNRESCGVRHGGIWSHITLELLAFLATLVEKVLYEWSTGISIETPFIVERWRQTYTEHLDKLRQQHKMCAAAMDVHCKRLVTTARDALGSGPDLSERPKSGVTSTSIELWAQRYAPALLTESALSVSNSQNEPTQAFAQETDFEGDLPMDTIHTQLQADGDLNEGMESLEEILAGSQQMYQATRSSLLAPQAMQEVLSDMPTVHSPGSGSFPSRRMNESTNILPPAQAPLQNQINEDTQTESEHDSYIAPQHPSVPAQPKPINEDTQTESEPDSIYETLRPSQSISQVRPNPNAPTQALSPATSFDQTCSSWVAGWVGLRSISQDHAEEFEREYPEVPPVNTGISESL